jgi:hypothetical protein
MAQQYSVEESMNRVLEAERTAHTAVAECEAHAATLLDAAQQQVRRIHIRTDARLGRLHAHCGLEVARQMELLLRQENTAAAATPSDAMREVLAAAVERLAQTLTDAPDGDT